MAQEGHFVRGSLGFYAFPGGLAVKNLPSARAAGDTGSVPESGRPPGEGNGNPRRCSCLGNSVGSMGSQRVGQD